jgi:phosphoribosylanthranilate isomerase
MARTRIKICGIKDDDALYAAAEGGADAVGFMFVKDSARYIEPEDAYGLLAALPPFVASVSVFADIDLDVFSDIEEICPTSYTQLHGEENEKQVMAMGPDIIKAVKFDPASAGTPSGGPFASELARWSDSNDVLAILIDGAAGGTGVPLDWERLAAFTDTLTKPIILAGGLTPQNVHEAIRIIRPYGVDVSSGVERARGVKDPEKILEFCQAVRKADAEMNQE